MFNACSTLFTVDIYEKLRPKASQSELVRMGRLATGVMVLIGLGTRISLFVQGLIYTALTVGLILIKQDDGISWLGIHIALVAFALVLAKNNKFALLKKW